MKIEGSLSFLVGTINNVLVMEIGWTDVGSGGYILMSCASLKLFHFDFFLGENRNDEGKGSSIKRSGRKIRGYGSLPTNVKG